MVKASVVIPTWNRARLLNKTLRRMVEVGVPEDWDVLVIDNNCTDHTPDVLDRYLDELPLRVIMETKQGVAHARNAGIDNSTGDYIVWVDDDVYSDDCRLVGLLEGRFFSVGGLCSLAEN